MASVSCKVVSAYRVCYIDDNNDDNDSDNENDINSISDT